MIRYFAKINNRWVGISGLNAEIRNIRCPICGFKMKIGKIEPKDRKMEVNRKTDDKGHLWHTETKSCAYDIKWRCMNCTAELSAMVTEYCETSIDLDDCTAELSVTTETSIDIDDDTKTK